MERTSYIRGDFIERFSIFTNAYGRARSKEEKSYLAEDFLKNCTDDEVALVRDVIGDVLQKNRFNLPYKLFD
jgi:hypothetical protein